MPLLLRQALIRCCEAKTLAEPLVGVDVLRGAAWVEAGAGAGAAGVEAGAGWPVFTVEATVPYFIRTPQVCGPTIPSAPILFAC